MYDFTYFIEVINTHGISVEMYHADFKEFRNELSRGEKDYFLFYSLLMHFYLRVGWQCPYE